MNPVLACSKHRVFEVSLPLFHSKSSQLEWRLICCSLGVHKHSYCWLSVKCYSEQTDLLFILWIFVHLMRFMHGKVHLLTWGALGFAGHSMFSQNPIHGNQRELWWCNANGSSQKSIYWHILIKLKSELCLAIAEVVVLSLNNCYTLTSCCSSANGRQALKQRDSCLQEMLSTFLICSILEHVLQKPLFFNTSPSPFC